MNTIQTEDENFVCSRVEGTLVGTVDNEEHLSDLRERKEQEDTENMIRKFLLIYTLYLILDYHGPLIDTWILQEYMNR
jgi:hypothetical protein